VYLPYLSSSDFIRSLLIVGASTNRVFDVSNFSRFEIKLPKTPTTVFTGTHAYNTS